MDGFIHLLETGDEDFLVMQLDPALEKYYMQAVKYILDNVPKERDFGDLRNVPSLSQLIAKGSTTVEDVKIYVELMKRIGWLNPISNARNGMIEAILRKKHDIIAYFLANLMDNIQEHDVVVQAAIEFKNREVMHYYFVHRPEEAFWYFYLYRDEYLRGNNVEEWENLRKGIVYGMEAPVIAFHIAAVNQNNPNPAVQELARNTYIAMLPHVSPDTQRAMEMHLQDEHKEGLRRGTARYLESLRVQREIPESVMDIVMDGVHKWRDPPQKQ